MKKIVIGVTGASGTVTRSTCRSWDLPDVERTWSCLGEENLALETDYTLDRLRRWPM